MNLPNMDWTPIQNDFWGLSTCKPIDHPEYIMPFAQTVDNAFIADGSQYHCLNRGDENPFLITKNETKTWTQWINTPCEDPDWERRCLGSNPNVCVMAEGKYILTILITQNIMTYLTFNKSLPAHHLELLE